MAKKPPNQHIPQEFSLSDNLVVDVATRFGTPLYIYDRSALQKRWQNLTSALPEGIVIYYSVKANPNLSIVKSFHELGSNFEVTSLGELVITLHAGVPASKVIFVGPGKTDQELLAAISQQVGVIVVESEHELMRIEQIARDSEQNNAAQVRVALRINPGVGQGMLSMGGVTQFGMDPDTALDILLKPETYPHVTVIGVHGYLGARILDSRIIAEHTRLILSIASDLQRQTDMEFTFLDIGGGFGVPFYEVEEPLDTTAMRQALGQLLNEYRVMHPHTKVYAVESGRFLIAPCGVFVTRIIDVKSFQEQRFAIVDGGINVFGGHDRYAGSRPTPIRLLGQRTNEPQTVTLCGPLCTPMDRLAANVVLPNPEIGDLVVFYLAGAYGLTASPGLFLGHGFSCEVMVMGDSYNLIRRRTSPEDLLTGQVNFEVKL